MTADEDDDWRDVGMRARAGGVAGAAGGMAVSALATPPAPAKPQ